MALAVQSQQCTGKQWMLCPDIGPPYSRGDLASHGLFLAVGHNRLCLSHPTAHAGRCRLLLAVAHIGTCPSPAAGRLPIRAWQTCP